VSPLPLIFTVLEQPVVLAMHAAYGVAVLMWMSRSESHRSAGGPRQPTAASWFLFGVCGTALLTFYYTHRGLVPTMPFLHLMLCQSCALLELRRAGCSCTHCCGWRPTIFQWGSMHRAQRRFSDDLLRCTSGRLVHVLC